MMLLIAKFIFGFLYLLNEAQATKSYIGFGHSKTVPNSRPEHRQRRKVVDSHVCRDVDKSLKYDFNGYEPIGKGIKLTVNFFKLNGKWNGNVSWDHPIKTENRSKCTGYYVIWFRDGAIIPPYCEIIMNENITHYIVDNTKEINTHEKLGIVVLPLPLKTNVNLRFYYRWFSIATTNMASRTPTPSASQTTSLSPTKTVHKSEISSKKSTPSPLPKTDVYQLGTTSKNTMSTFVLAIVILSIVVVTMVISVVIVWKYRRTRNPLRLVMFENRNAKSRGNHNEEIQSNYISYYDDNDRITVIAIGIANWLSQQNLSVTIDKFNNITDNKRRWCDRHISFAKRVILIVSPGYLNISKLDENFNQDKENIFSYKDQLANNEICHIRDEVTKKASATHRFIVILVETEFKELPYWMKKLKVYKYSGDGVVDNILEVLI